MHALGLKNSRIPLSSISCHHIVGLTSERLHPTQQYLPRPQSFLLPVRLQTAQTAEKEQKDVLRL
jgi:hypothetical protein